jgi:hypothetical protein
VRLSRVALVFGLLISVAVHVWLLRMPKHAELLLPPPVIPIVETELAMNQPAPEPETVVEPEPKPEPEPAPEPEPEPLPPPMEKVAEAPHTETEAPGDYAGKTDGAREPELRINWGTADEARSALEAGDMVIVVLETGPDGPVIAQQVGLDEGTWRRRPYQPHGATVYSNRLRIVDEVPAFDVVCDAVGLGLHERLAVLVPMRVERVLQSAQMAAAYRTGLAMGQIDSFAGRFTLDEGRLDFNVTHVGRSERSATP